MQEISIIIQFCRKLESVGPIQQNLSCLRLMESLLRLAFKLANVNRTCDALWASTSQRWASTSLDTVNHDHARSSHRPPDSNDRTHCKQQVLDSNPTQGNILYRIENLQSVERRLEFSEFSQTTRALELLHKKGVVANLG